MQLQPGEAVVLQQATVWYSAPARPNGMLTLTNVRLVFEIYSGGYMYPGMELSLDKILNAFPDNLRGDLLIDSVAALSVDSPFGRASFDMPNAWQWAQAIGQSRSSFRPAPPPPPPPPPPAPPSTGTPLPP